MFKKTILFLLFFIVSLKTDAAVLHIVAAETVYGNIAKEITGPYAEVMSLMNNPNQDPHLFSVSVASAKAVSKANLIIYNGLDYDPWMKKLVESNNIKNKNIIIIADILNRNSGDNPHLWYDVVGMIKYTQALSQKLSILDSSHQIYYKIQQEKFEKACQEILSKVNFIKAQCKSISVIATEPVFNLMVKALGFNMLGEQFQLSMMNGIAPSAMSVKDFEESLKQRKAKIFIYNHQVSNPLTERMKMIAMQSGIPVIGVSETEPPDQDYVSWMQYQLNDIQKVIPCHHD